MEGLLRWRVSCSSQSSGWLTELSCAVYLTSDAVIAATKDTMEDTIAYIDENYEGAANYLHDV